MAKKNLFQRIKDWFTGGNSSKRASSYRGSSNTRATNNYTGYRTKSEDDERKRKAEEQKAKIEKAFAVSVNTKADDSKSKKRVDTSNKSTKAWKKTAEKEFGVTDAKSNRLAQLDPKYWQKQEEHSAKYNPVGLSMAKGAVSGVTMNADKLLVNSDKDAKARQEKVQKIMEKNGGEKSVKRANVVGELAGTMATFGLGTAGARGAVEGSKAVAKATSKLANTEIVRKASARAIEKGLAKGSIEEVSQQLAKKLATEFGADVAVDNTLGLIDATTRASLAEDGEKGKEFLTNVGINALATGTLDLAPTLVKALKGAKSLKNVEKKELEKAVEEVAKAELPKQAEKEAVPNIGYHAGTLNGSKKAEPFLISNGDRSTGHYGTGTYIAGNKDLLDYEHSGYSDRDLWEIDMDNYKLFRPKDADEAGRLHSSLKEINSRSRKYNSVKDIDFEDLRQRVANGDDDAYEQLLKYVDKDDLARYERRAKEYIEQYGQAPTKEEIRSEAIRQLEKESREVDLYDLDFDDFMKAIESDDYSGISSAKPELTESQIADRIAQLEGKYRDESNLQARIRKEVEFETDKILEPYIEVESLTKDRTDEFGDLYSSTYSKLKKLFPDIEESELKRAFDETMDEVERINNLPYNAQLMADSPSTILMKKLGYEGIDVRGIKGYDNTAYGSVIYDLDKSRAKKIREGKAELPATEAKVVAESPTASVLEQDLKHIEEGKPLDAPVEPPAPKAEAQPNGAVADDVMDSIGQDPEVRKMFDEAQLEDDRRILNSTNGYIDTSTFGSRTEIKDLSIEQFLGREAFDEVRPASEHQLNGHFGTRNDVSYSEVMALKEKQELAKKLADENGERVTDSSITSYSMSKDKEFQDEAVAKMDELGITAKDGEMNINERMSNHLYDPKYKKLSYREMCAVAREDVYNNPKAVMNHLYSLMKTGDRFTAVDLALSAQLVEYGDRFAVPCASDLGHMFLMDYANEMGRISGMYQFISKQWNLLSGEKKVDYLYKQVKKYAKDMNLGSIEDIKQLIQNAYASRVSESGEDIYENLMKNRGEGNYQYDLLTIDRDKISVFDVLVDNVINSTDENYTKLAKAELWQSINGTVEPTFLNNLMTWRYFSMLGNPATHMRNLTGNFVFTGVRSVSDVFTTGIENIMHSMGKIDFKSRAILTPSEIKDILGGKGTYGSVIDKALEEDLEGIMKSSQGYKNQLIDEFGTANLNLAEKGIKKGADVIGNYLEKEDKLFVAFNYQKSLGQFLKANGYGSGAGNKMLKANGGRFENDEAILEAGRNWARQDAQEATFRNFNDLSRMLNSAVRKGEKRNATALEKGIAFGTNAIVPFTTTPINILVQGARFSPLGFTKHAVGLMKATSPEDYIKHAEGLGAGLTGTGILALGMWLSSNNSESVAGIQFMSSAGEDERAKALKRAGYQDYSVVFTDGEGHGISYSFEWCSPIAQTLFTGVEIGRMMRGGLNAGNETTGFDRLGNITQIASRMVDPTLQMSVLQGVNTFIEGANNISGVSGAVSGVTALAQNYFGSLIPSFMGALSRTVSPYDYNLVGTSSTEMGSNLEYTINAQKAKLPFLATAMLAPKVNEKGEIVGKKESAGDYAKAFAKNMFSVGKYQKIDMTDADRDAIKTYDEAIADGIDPDTAKQVFAKVDYSTEKKIGKTDKKYGLKKETLNLDKWERATSQQNRSKNGADAIDALLESKAWNAQVSKDNRESRQAELRAKAPKSTSEALDILVNTPEYKGANADEKIAMRNAILDKATKYSANKETYMNRGHSEAEYDFLEKVPARVQHAYNTSGLSDILTKEQIVDATKGMAKVSYSEDGTRRTYYSKKSMLAYLDKADLSEEQKKALYNTFKNKNAKGYGQGGSGGRRRSGGSSSSKSSTKSQAKLSAFKPSVKNSDFKSITKNINQDYGKIKREFGLTDAELQAIIKQANRDSLSLRGK